MYQLFPHCYLVLKSIVYPSLMDLNPWLRDDLWTIVKPNRISQLH